MGLFRNLALAVAGLGKDTPLGRQERRGNMARRMWRCYYQGKYTETTKHKHKRALVLTARKSVGLFVGLLHRNEPYRSREERRT